MISHKYTITRSKTSATSLFFLSCFVFTTVTTYAADPKAASKADPKAVSKSVDIGKPFLRLDDKRFYLKDLIGLNDKELSQTITKKLLQFNDAQLEQALNEYGVMGADGKSRAQQEEIYSSRIRALILANITRRLVAAEIYNNIVKVHKINPEEYFDLSEALKYEKQFVGLMDFLYSKKLEDDAGENTLYHSAIENFGYKLPYEDWQVERGLLNPDNLAGRLSLVFDKANIETVMKARMAHFLLKEALETGIYYEMAKSLHQFDIATLYRVEVTNFAGGLTAIENLSQAVVDKEGDLLLGGYSTFGKILAKYPGQAKINYRAVFGAEVRKEFGIPAIGHVYTPKPKTYWFFAWKNNDVNEDPQAASVFQKVYATQLAAEDYMPKVEWENEESVPREVLLNSIENGSFGPEIPIPVLAKMEYPAKEFSEIPQLRINSDSFIAKYTAAKINDDAVGMQAALQLFRDENKNVQTNAGKNLVNQVTDITQ